MDNEIDMKELEEEQLDYLRRNYDKTMRIPNSTDMNLDILEKPIDDRITLTPEQEKALLKEVMRQQISAEKEYGKKKYSFSFSAYFDMLVVSFVDIMDDILNFDGDIENISKIFTKDDRLVFIGTVIFCIAVFALYSKRTQ
jgi:hypothetical protein